MSPRQRFDAERSKLESATAQVAQLGAELNVAELPARDAKRVAAEATLMAARADAELARARLEDRVIMSPASGLVERVFYDAGEVIGAASSAISILPPGKLEAVFFVPEPERAEVRLATC